MTVPSIRAQATDTLGKTEVASSVLGGFNRPTVGYSANTDVGIVLITAGSYLRYNFLFNLC